MRTTILLLLIGLAGCGSTGPQTKRQKSAPSCKAPQTLAPFNGRVFARPPEWVEAQGKVSKRSPYNVNNNTVPYVGINQLWRVDTCRGPYEYWVPRVEVRGIPCDRQGTIETDMGFMLICTDAIWHLNQSTGAHRMFRVRDLGIHGEIRGIPHEHKTWRNKRYEFTIGDLRLTWNQQLNRWFLWSAQGKAIPEGALNAWLNFHRRKRW